MRISCTPGPVLRVRRLPAARVDELCAAIRRVRSGGGDHDRAVFTLERGYSGRGRAIARLLVGTGVVVVLLAAVVAFVAPSTAVTVVGLVVAPGVVVVAATTAFSIVHDTGLTIRGDGSLRSEGWRGIRVVDLNAFDEVSVGGRTVV